MRGEGTMAMIVVLGLLVFGMAFIAIRRAGRELRGSLGGKRSDAARDEAFRALMQAAAAQKKKASEGKLPPDAR